MGQTVTKKKAAKKKATKKKASAKKKVAKKKPTAKKRRGRSSSAQNVRKELAAIEAEEKLIDAYLHGASTNEIAKITGRSPRRVREAIQRLRTHWREDNARQFNEAVNRTALTALYLQKRALEAWEISKREPVTVTTFNADGSVSVQSTVTPAGDPKLLEIAGKMNHQLASIHGVLDRDNTMAVSVSQASPILEVIVESRQDVADLKIMSLGDLQGVVVPAAKLGQTPQ
jgi:arsenate reductase-like glutaredoxin family protein